MLIEIFFCVGTYFNEQELLVSTGTKDTNLV